MLDDSWRNDLSEILDLAIEAHEETTNRYNCVEYPSLIYTLSYQDGLKHGIQFLLARSQSGEYSHPCHLTAKIKAYTDLLKERRKQKRYSDIAYIEGYLNALLLPLLPEDERFSIPLYYLAGCKKDIYDLEDFESILPSSNILHIAAHKKAEAIVKRLSNNDPEIVFHHPPFL